MLALVYLLSQIFDLNVHSFVGCSQMVLFTPHQGLSSRISTFHQSVEQTHHYFLWSFDGFEVIENFINEPLLQK